MNASERARTRERVRDGVRGSLGGSPVPDIGGAERRERLSGGAIFLCEPWHRTISRGFSVVHDVVTAYVQAGRAQQLLLPSSHAVHGVALPHTHTHIRTTRTTHAIVEQHTASRALPRPPHSRSPTSPHTTSPSSRSTLTTREVGHQEFRRARPFCSGRRARFVQDAHGSHRRRPRSGCGGSGGSPGQTARLQHCARTRERRRCIPENDGRRSACE